MKLFQKQPLLILSVVGVVAGTCLGTQEYSNPDQILSCQQPATPSDAKNMYDPTDGNGIRMINGGSGCYLQVWQMPGCVSSGGTEVTLQVTIRGLPVSLKYISGVSNETAGFNPYPAADDPATPEDERQGEWWQNKKIEAYDWSGFTEKGIATEG